MLLTGELKLYIDEGTHWMRMRAFAGEIFFFALFFLFLQINSVDVLAESTDGHIEARLGRIESILASKALIELVGQVELLQQEVRSLNGQIENQTFEVESSNAELEKRIGSLSDRIDSIEFGRDTTQEQKGSRDIILEEAIFDNNELTDPDSRADPIAAVEATIVPPLTLDPETMFNDAAERLKLGDYVSAIEAFNTFFTLYPDSLYADDALFRVAEAYYLKRDYREAVTEYERLIRIFPESANRAPAMLKLAYSHHELGDTPTALLVVKELQSMYPMSVSARLADERMSRISNAD